MAVIITQVDAFTDKLFGGNPAAVCILHELRDLEWMKSVAREMNLSETAFVLKEDRTFNLRWFTPEMEVDLCGHATLASAHVLWEMGYLKTTEAIQFYTRSGILSAEKAIDRIELNFPCQPVMDLFDTDTALTNQLVEALGIRPQYIGKNSLDYLLVEVESETLVRNMKPDFEKLSKIPHFGIIVTSISETRECDFVSRFFAPNAGIKEDPVTGSSHCTLGPYWSKRLNKSELIAYQASSRGGQVHIRLEGDRVLLGGKAVTVLRGALLDQ
jgi:PhzF family phenazine biosynthesis protein